MKLSKKTWVFFGACVAMMLFIFSNSLKNGEESMAVSDGVIGFLQPVLNLLEAVFGQADWVFIIRKCGHLTEFCIFGILCHGFLYCLQRDLGKTFYGFGLFVCLMTGVADEFIQRYTGRTSSVADVLIDFTGALLGLGIVMLWRLLRGKIARRKS